MHVKILKRFLLHPELVPLWSGKGNDFPRFTSWWILTQQTSQFKDFARSCICTGKNTSKLLRQLLLSLQYWNLEYLYSININLSQRQENILHLFITGLMLFWWSWF